MRKPKTQSSEASVNPNSKGPKAKRVSVSQTDVPTCSLSKALRVGTAIADNYAKQPSKPLRVAEAMGMTPTSGPFRMLCGASIAYGITEGGYNVEFIKLTPLGRRIVAPTKEGDDLSAKREATLNPRVIKDFLTRYNDSKIPSQQIALNVIEEMGVPANRARATLDLILESAKEVGFLRDLKGSLYVDLQGGNVDNPSEVEMGKVDEAQNTFDKSDSDSPEVISRVASSQLVAPSLAQAAPPNNRVFITHGKNKDILNKIKELLAFGNFHPIISVENETVSKPVPDKVMDDMRSCSAAIVHVGAEMKVMDTEGTEHNILNPNVLIEIGACMALYRRRFILLVEKGVRLPSNLQGLYEVRYEGSALDYASTMKLLKAFNDFKS